jgi:hypothetical protein
LQLELEIDSRKGVHISHINVLKHAKGKAI